MDYFAYGSNMNFVRMAKRCPGNCFIGKAALKGYKFIYDVTSNDGGAVGNIIKDDNESVFGGLYKINNAHLKTLDSCEGYCLNPISYDRNEFIVKMEDGKSLSAIAYFRTGKTVGEPIPEYREIVIQGARDCGLSEEYIQKYLL
jgi:gamma-glutamylcyclotransferase